LERARELKSGLDWVPLPALNNKERACRVWDIQVYGLLFVKQFGAYLAPMAKYRKDLGTKKNHLGYLLELVITPKGQD